MLPKWLSTRARAILVYDAVDPCTVPQVEKAAKASSRGVALLPSQQVAGRDHLAVGAGAEPPLDKQVQAGEVRHHLQAELRD